MLRSSERFKTIYTPVTLLDTTPDVELHDRLGEWKKTVLAELKGDSFEKRLITRTFDDIALSPLYTRGDVSAIRDLVTVPNQAPFLRGKRSGPGGRRWQIAQEICASDPVAYNKALLAQLSSGQDAVVLWPNDLTLAASGSASGLRCDPGISLRSVRDFSLALSSVDLRAVAVHLNAGADARALASLFLAFAQGQGIPFSQLTGSVTADPLADAAETGRFPGDLGENCDALAEWTRWASDNAPNLQTVSINARIWTDAGATATEELAIALATAAEYLRALLHRGISLETIAPRLRFNFSAGSQFFTEIAKFRAFRPLLTRVLVAFQGKASLGSAGSMNAATSRWNKTLLDPHVNLLRVTTEALSAVLGGCDAISIAPFDCVSGTTTEISRRIALNVHTLLAEEFGFTDPADPAGGSWYIEKLTDEIARAAWIKFQDFESRGGFSACLRSGYAQEMVENTRKTKARAVATRRLALVGTNLFPNQKDAFGKRRSPLLSTSTENSPISILPSTRSFPQSDLASKSDFLAAIEAAQRGTNAVELSGLFRNAKCEGVTIPPLSFTRAAEGFEAIRRESAAYDLRTGNRPNVFLAKMGPLAQHKARADFSATFMSLGGFDVVAGGGYDQPEVAAAAAIAAGSPIAILCSSDSSYLEIAPAFAQNLKAKAPHTVVVLAGLPSDPKTIAIFRNAGFDEFIHIRSNAEEVLTSFLNKIGAAQ